MCNLYAIAGRPSNGKTEYLKILRDNAEQTFKMISALDFETHENLVRELYNLVQDDDCQCIAIDDYEVKLIQSWEGKVIDEEYKKALSILAGFSDSFDVNVIVVVGLKSEADKEDGNYYDRANLCSPVIEEETDEIFFIKYGLIDTLRHVDISYNPWIHAAILAMPEYATEHEFGDWNKYRNIVMNEMYFAQMENCILFHGQIEEILQGLGGFDEDEAKNVRKAMALKKSKDVEKYKKIFIENASVYGYDERRAGEVFEYLFKHSGYTVNETYWMKFAMFSGMYDNPNNIQIPMEDVYSERTLLEMVNDHIDCMIENVEALVKVRKGNEEYKRYLDKLCDISKETQRLLDAVDDDES